MRANRRYFSLAFALCFSLLPVLASPQETRWFKKVLVTNDDGIGDASMQALARAFAKVAKTVVVAPLADSSGTSNYASFWRKGELRVERSKLEGGIEVVGVDGTPADCVFLAFKGIMKDDPPDLVVSGINGAANLGDDWLWSGTVGAARAAALWGGKPSIAVSGMVEGNLDFVADWLIRFASGSYVASMKSGQYLVLSFPRVPSAAIKGVKIAKTTRLLSDYSLGNFGSRNPEVWKYAGHPREIPPEADSDKAYYDQGYIVIAPMRVDETDYAALDALKADPGSAGAFGK
jgi:5'-nucleotidase